MNIKYIIKGELPSLNEYIASINLNRYRGNKLKQDTQETIMWQLKQQGIQMVNVPVVVKFLWVCKNEKKDTDNVASAKKFCLDSLVKAGILQNDSRKWVKGFIDDFAIDKDNPRVEITLEYLREE